MTASSLTELELPPGGAVLLSLSVEGTKLWTADGRRHEGVPTLRLPDARPLRSNGYRPGCGTIRVAMGLRERVVEVSL
jgi:hypothetical protein